MSAPATQRSTPAYGRFWHEAFFYAGMEGFLAGTAEFISAGVQAGEPVLVVVDVEKIDRLRQALNGDAKYVTFLDMARVGRNPACIIPAWRDFVDRHIVTGQPVRGVGEPIWAGRSPSEMLECQLHEALLNTAFDDGPGWALMCPYDTTTLDDDTLDVARQTHPQIFEGGDRRSSTGYAGNAMGTLEAVLPEPPATSGTVTFDDETGLIALRQVVADHASYAGIDELRTEELILAVHEAAANSLRYGGGGGRMRLWQEPTTLVCEIADAGHIDELLIGRVRPTIEQEGGRGLWLINQLCDLVQVRSSVTGGTVVRMHVNRPH